MLSSFNLTLVSSKVNPLDLICFRDLWLVMQIVATKIGYFFIYLIL